MESSIVRWSLLLVIDLLYPFIAARNHSGFMDAWEECSTRGRQLYRPSAGNYAYLENKTVWTGRVAMLSSWIAYHGCYNQTLLSSDTTPCSDHSKGVNSCQRCCNNTVYFALQNSKCFCISSITKYTSTKVTENRCNAMTQNEFDVNYLGGNDVISLYQSVYGSNETVHRYLRCAAAQCVWNGNYVKYNPTNCTGQNPGLCSNGDLTSVVKYSESMTECLAADSKLESFDDAMKRYCSKHSHTDKFWTAFHRYVEVRGWDGNATFYMCETARVTQDSVRYFWTRDCKHEVLQLEYTCTTDAEHSHQEGSRSALVAGLVSGGTVLGLVIVIIVLLYIRGYREHKVPTLTRDSHSSHSSRVYVRSTDDLTPLPNPSQNIQDTEECNCTQLKESCKGEDPLYEVFDNHEDGNIDENPRASTSRVQTVSNQCYDLMAGNTNLALNKDEAEDTFPSYDSVISTASVRLPQRLFLNNEDGETTDDKEANGRDSDEEVMYKTIQSAHTVNKENGEGSRTSGCRETDEADDDVYDRELADVILKRASSKTGDEEVEEKTENGLYKEMTTKDPGFSYVPMSFEDTYKVIDPHFSLKKK